MENIDWFNLNQEEAESILPYLLQNLHLNSHITAAKFLLSQEHLTPYWYNRNEVLRKLEYQETHNATWGEKVLNRLRHYQESKYVRGQLYPSKWYKPHDFALDGRVDSYFFGDGVVRRNSRKNSTQKPKPRPKCLRRCRSLSPNTLPERFELSNLHRNWPSAETYWKKVEFARDTKALSGVDVIINYKYNSILLQMFMIVWHLPDAIVHLLMDYSLEALAFEYKRKHRKLRRSTVVDFSDLDYKSIEKLSPDYVGSEPSAALNFALTDVNHRRNRHSLTRQCGHNRHLRRRQQWEMNMKETEKCDTQYPQCNLRDESCKSEEKEDQTETVL